MNEKVQIPDNFEDSDAESESSSEKIRRLEGYEEVGKCSKLKEKENTQSFWCLENNSGLNVMNQMMQSKLAEKTIINSDNEASQVDQDVAKEDDNVVVNTQESTITNVETSQDDDLKKKLESQKCKMIADGKNLLAKEEQQGRRSDRLKKDILLSTQEKNEIMAKKRCMEGNISNITTLSTFQNSEICSLAKNMGIVIEEEDFDTFDTLKDLEMARANLYHKQQSNKPKKQPDVIEISEDEDETLLIEWHHEGSSESEDYLSTISVKKNTNKGRKKK